MRTIYISGRCFPLKTNSFIARHASDIVNRMLAIRISNEPVERFWIYKLIPVSSIMDNNIEYL